MFEIELKAQIEDPEPFREKLGEMTAELILIDTSYDKEDVLESNDSFIRIRRYEDKKSGESGAVITYKGPRDDSFAKKRVEFEVDINDPDKMEKILRTVGFLPIRTIKRRRDVYHFMGAEVVIDIFPNSMKFIEIEAKDEETIFKVSESLGIPKKDLTKKTYFEIMDENRV